MNKELFEKQFIEFGKILERNSGVLSEKEYKYRENILNKAFSETMVTGLISDSFYSIAHEIKSIDLFNRLGEVHVMLDSSDEPGIDLIYDRNQIECVIATAGKGKNFDKICESGYQQSGVFDYNEKFRQISLRIIQSLVKKRDKFYIDLKKEVVNDSLPFSIFISLGSLSQEWFSGKNYFDATRFLLGVWHPSIMIDTKTGKQIGDPSYSYHPQIVNNNESDVTTNFFGDKNNEIVSSVILTDASLFHEYTNSNTVIFTNPFAVNRVKLKNFKGYTYWNVYSGNQYGPKRNGKRLSH